MTFGWASQPGRSVWWLAAAFLMNSTSAAVAQRATPIRRELGLQVLATIADPVLAGAGLYAAIRPGGNARVALTLTAAERDRQLAGRGELLAHFLLNPNRTRGVGIYGLGGVAALVQHRTRGYLVLGVGLETAPGRRSGWAVEAGAGGGVRLTAGWRARW